MRERYNVIANWLYQTIAPYTNINHTCPYDVSERESCIYILSSNIILTDFSLSLCSTTSFWTSCRCST